MSFCLCASACDLFCGTRNRLKEVEVQGRKILLVKHLDHVFAIGSKCSHYGLPLSKGLSGCLITNGIRIFCNGNRSRVQGDDPVSISRGVLLSEKRRY